MSKIHTKSQGVLVAGVKPEVTRQRFQTGNISTFLMTADGTNNATNSTTLINNGSTSATYTPSGVAVQCGFNPFGVNSLGSMYFNGASGSYINVSDNSDWAIGSSDDFTIECFVYLTATPSAQGGQIWGRQEYGLNSNYVFGIDNSRRLFTYWDNGAGTITRTTSAMNLNQWYHIAVSRVGSSSGNFKMFVDGVGQSFTMTGGNGNKSDGNWTIGADQVGDESRFTGFIKDLHFVKGTGLYSENFTAPTASLSTVSNSKLMLRFNNFTGVADIGSSGLPLTVYGNAKLSNGQTKYGSTSLLLDGVSDGAQILLSQNNSNWSFDGAFTMEAWIRLTAMHGSDIVIHIIGAHEYGTATNFMFGLTNGYKLRFTVGSTDHTGATSINLNEWTHVAVVRNASNTLKLFVNGVEDYSGTQTGTIAATNYPVTIGVDNAGDEAEITGNLADIRVVKAALYTGTFTPPESQATVDAAGLVTVTNNVYGVYQLG